MRFLIKHAIRVTLCDYSFQYFLIAGLPMAIGIHLLLASPVSAPICEFFYILSESNSAAKLSYVCVSRISFAFSTQCVLKSWTKWLYTFV